MIVVVSPRWKEQANCHIFIGVRETSKKFADPDENIILFSSLPVWRDDDYEICLVFCQIREVVVVVVLLLLMLVVVAVVVIVVVVVAVAVVVKVAVAIVVV